jgi:hypothetical protein
MQVDNHTEYVHFVNESLLILEIVLKIKYSIGMKPV